MTLFGKAAWWMPRWLGRILPHADIEGEQLREHRIATEWASQQEGMAISAEYLIVGSPEQETGPISVEVPTGALVIASGDMVSRRLLAATLSGRLDPVSGRAQVMGVPIPSDSSRVRTLVALANVGGSERSETSVTVGQLLVERLETTQPWFRLFGNHRRADQWLQRVNSAVRRATRREVVPVRASSTLLELPQLERAVALAAVAFAENTPVVMLDQLDSFASSDDEQAFIDALQLLAPAETTIVIGTPLPARALTLDDPDARLLLTIDLYSLTTEGSLR